ncbi:MAG: hypothetical protein KF760_22635 [Candidatus Eremiobacteraeota bacterium]|nr:hypothetical protein [Candidatus Eremiobacteraeota bacterium]MCW5868570.1 hypothetical protein [Candidatus Eremiobacteraeota bacterium]
MMKRRHFLSSSVILAGGLVARQVQNDDSLWKFQGCASEQSGSVAYEAIAREAGY